MTFFLHRSVLAAAAFAGLSTAAQAHVTFEAAQVPANATVKAVLRVPHGCDGQPTTAIHIRMPEGVADVKPMPKAGWSLAAEPGPAPETIREIVWSGGSLPDAFYDEFAFRLRLPAELAGRVLAFPVVQECGRASERWEQLAQAGQDPHALTNPAPTMAVATAQAAAPSSSAVKAAGLVIEQPWSRATPGGAKVGGGYVRITNTGSTPDRLIGGSFTASGRVELHDMTVTDGIMRMKPAEGGIEIAPGATVELKPGGSHAMFLDLQRPLREGDRVDGTLVFEKAGSVPVTYTIRSLGAQTAGEDHSRH
jgi:periplasmic copper chaperone A